MASPHDNPARPPRATEAVPAWRAHERQAPIVVGEPGFVELSDAQRREAVNALTDILAAWWQRHGDATAPVQPRTGEQRNNDRADTVTSTADKSTADE